MAARFNIRKFVLGLTACMVMAPSAARAEMTDFPIIKLQSLDKITARTMTFEARVGSTVKFGPLYIKIRSCRKAPPIETPESAAFLQIWEVTPKDESKWVFSGWMFASSPALSPMDHPIYDVWVLDCLEEKSDKVEENPASEAAEDTPAEHQDDGEISDDAAAATEPKESPSEEAEAATD